MGNYDENKKLDDFLDEPKSQRSGGAYPNGQPYGYKNQQHMVAPRKKNLTIPILLSVIVAIGIIILLIQIFHPFNNGDNNVPGGTNNGGYHQQDPSPNRNGDDNEPPPPGGQKSGRQRIGE